MGVSTLNIEEKIMAAAAHADKVRELVEELAVEAQRRDDTIVALELRLIHSSIKAVDRHLHRVQLHWTPTTPK